MEKIEISDHMFTYTSIYIVCIQYRNKNLNKPASVISLNPITAVAVVNHEKPQQEENSDKPVKKSSATPPSESDNLSKLNVFRKY